jgi:ABC-2 type transport system ATP-binding protein
VTAVIEVSDLQKGYGSVRAVDGVSFSIEPGEFFGILGPNGAGKTTTLEIIEGLREPDRGQTLLFGKSSWPRDTRLLRRIGVQLQTSAFFERLTAREQLSTFAALYGVPDSRVGDMLELVGLTEQGDTLTDRLSGARCSVCRSPAHSSTTQSWSSSTSRRQVSTRRPAANSGICSGPSTRTVAPSC